MILFSWRKDKVVLTEEKHLGQTDKDEESEERTKEKKNDRIRGALNESKHIDSTSFIIFITKKKIQNNHSSQLYLEWYETNKKRIWKIEENKKRSLYVFLVTFRIILKNRIIKRKFLSEYSEKNYQIFFYFVIIMLMFIIIMKLCGEKIYDVKMNYCWTC